MLSWIDFGKVSAERDDLLSSYFFDNGVLQSVVSSPSSFLVLGRKGAGKTAVFRYLTENTKQFIGVDDILVPLSFEDYNWNIHSLLTNENKAESMLYKQSWRFMILVEALKAYKTWFEKERKTVPKRIALATKLLEKLFDSPVPSIYQIVGRKLLSLSALKLPSGGLDLEDGGIDSISVGAGEISFDAVRADKDLRQHLSENIENLINHLDRALSEADATWPRVFVCFDRVDEAWDEVSYEASRKVIAGLVSASDAINSQFKGKLRPIVFLREDIFDVLSINDANKLREDCGALLNWNKKSLTSLILRRVNYFGKLHQQAQIVDLDSMFDKQAMRQGAKPSSYLLRRTMMRPRDLISLFSRTVETMREKANDPFAEDNIEFDKLECEAIYSAEPGYSEWLKQELLDEWKVQRPVIINLFHAIQNNGSTNFTQEKLSDGLQKLIGEISLADMLTHLRFLFDNSVIGFKLGASTEWRFKCFYPSQGFLESDEYRVHEGLVRALNLKEARERNEA
ncbi:P-loop ATPase, Sll1717 family [Janthinobacterium sp. UMAB-56]|uniref:P-loop ATPase, Sll1717 family n=1 Tax=Janthinobacterium sp. UMAB-56 TaxID=1365361 RepID=UPI0035ABE214